MSINTDAIVKTPAATPAPSSTSAAGGQKQLDKTYNDFLKLLLVQLKNQDPTNPIDTTQFTQQLVSLSQVQQSVNTNTNLEKLIASAQGAQINNAVSYIGKTVDATGKQSELLDGKAEFVYSLPSTAREATVTITDSAGKVVFSGPGSTKEGKNIVAWNGTNNISGQIMPDGVYNLTVTAKDATGKDMTPTTYTTGVVSSIDLAGGIVLLSLGDGSVKVPLENVASIRGAATVTGPVNG